MGRKFGDLDAYFDPGLTLTVCGREYTLPLPSAEFGLWCRRAQAMAGEISAASTPQEMAAAVERAEALPELPGDLTHYERLLGHVYQQMLDDQVPDPYVQFCAEVAYIWIVAGEDAAERYWLSGGRRPEAAGPVPNRADRRATQRTARKTSTAAASGTRTRVSSSGTSSPRKSSGSATRAPSRGRKSSNTG